MSKGVKTLATHVDLDSGADAVAYFIEKFCFPKVFLVTGGACAFMVDAIGRNNNLDFVTFQHEQSAAMAADAIWRTNSQVGVTMATSGPGATNLITGIACSWFDSIPSLHITGQVNSNESSKYLGVNVRQAGFQETDIVSMVKPITKAAEYFDSVDKLVSELPELLKIALSDRKGPILVDIPMDVQKAKLTTNQKEKILNWSIDLETPKIGFTNISKEVDLLFSNSSRPLVLIGAGAANSGKLSEIQKWCIDNNLLHVSSWGAMPSLDRGNNLYLGSIGVYGSRYANRVLQNSDAILILGSRLDNRQRTGNPNAFAPFARKIVIDIDNEELKKFEKDPTYSGFCIDLSLAEDILPKIMNQHQHNVWVSEVLGERALVNEGFDWACKPENLNPYYSIREIQEKFEANSIAVSDCGANLCWVYQSYLPSKTFLFTAGGNSPMGYSLPAAIGAAIANPSKTIYAFIGDGGLQMNIQELQTVVSLQLNIKVIIQNNFGYGIIKQFQDAYFNSRYFATGEGYSQPNFESISKAYGMKHTILSSVYDIRNFKFIYGPEVLELIHDANTLITPKVEMDRFLHDQFPYINDEKISDMHFQYPKAPSHLTKSKS